MCIQHSKNCIADMLHTFENLVAWKVVATLFNHLTNVLIWLLSCSEYSSFHPSIHPSPNKLKLKSWIRNSWDYGTYFSWYSSSVLCLFTFLVIYWGLCSSVQHGSCCRVHRNKILPNTKFQLGQSWEILGKVKPLQSCTFTFFTQS